MVFRNKDVYRYTQCPKLFYKEYKDPQQGFPFIYFSTPLVELAKEYLHIQEEDCYVGVPSSTTEETLAGWNGKTWCISGRFEAFNYREKPSILKREEDGIHYIMLCTTCHPKEDKVAQAYRVKWLLEQCGVQITHVSLLHLNGEYVRQGELDIEQLFVLSDHYYKDNNRPGKLMDEAISHYTLDMISTLENMTALVEQEEIEENYSLSCTRTGKCKYYKECFQEDLLPDDSILFLNGSRKKYEMFRNGITSIKELTFNEVDGSYIQWAQYRSSVLDSDHIEYNSLSSFMNTYLQDDLIYVDFEWDTIGIPMYDGMKPYDVLPFQYSVHIENHDGELEHREYLSRGGEDCREEFIQRLLADIPEKGTLVAYNADGAEVIRLQELARQFPQYEEALRGLWERFVDLSYPIMQGIVYLKKMRNTYSLKKLLSIIDPSDNYGTLDIDHGLKAVEAYRQLPTLSLEEQEKVREELFAYCGMDTLAMVKLVHFLKDKMNQYQKEIKDTYERIDEGDR
ncbi:MAG: DUF2779 domain-containing protein [Erysipelotrichaceae bacterium]|nr:DUF2779 domain-containing protein [Erysipelotrichaceae bacterium]